MIWEHRMIDLTEENGGEPWFSVHEVYYNHNGVLIGSSEPCFGSETKEGLRDILTRMLKSLDEPVFIPPKMDKTCKED
jgi:hypothetical protein